MKCPTVGHEKREFMRRFIGFEKTPMANPPIRASSADARNDRGVRPLRYKSQVISRKHCEVVGKS